MGRLVVALLGAGRKHPLHSLTLTWQFRYMTIVAFVLVMLTTVVAFRMSGLSLTAVLWHRVLMAMASFPVMSFVGTAKSLLPQVIVGPFSRSVLLTVYRLNITFLGMVSWPSAIPILVLIGMPVSATVLLLPQANALFPIARAQAGVLGAGLGPGLGPGLGTPL